MGDQDHLLNTKILILVDLTDCPMGKRTEIGYSGLTQILNN